MLLQGGPPVDRVQQVANLSLEIGLPDFPLSLFFPQHLVLVFEVVDGLLQVSLHPCRLRVPQQSVGILRLHILVLLRVEEGFVLQSGLLSSLGGHFQIPTHDSHFVVQLLDFAFQVCDLEIPLLDLLPQPVLEIVGGIHLFLVILLHLVVLILQSRLLFRPLLAFPCLRVEPSLVLALQLRNLVLQFADFSFVEALHLLHFQIQRFDFLVLVVDLFLQVPLLVDELFLIQVALLDLLVVRNVSQRRFGCLILVILLMQCHLIPHHLHISFVDGFVLVQSVLVIDPQFEFVLHLLGQLVSQIIQHRSQSLCFSVVCCETVLHQ